MNDWAFELVSAWGLWVVAGSAFVSCLAVPVPTSLVMLAAGIGCLVVLARHRVRRA